MHLLLGQNIFAFLRIFESFSSLCIFVSTSNKLQGIKGKKKKKKRAMQVCMPGSRLKDVWQKTLTLELQICLHALMPHFITSHSAKLPPPLLYLEYKKPFKTLNGEGWASWSWLLSLLGFTYSIMHCRSLQERRGVRMSRCEMWTQAVGEIHFLSLCRNDRQTGRPSHTFNHC